MHFNGLSTKRTAFYHITVNYFCITVSLLHRMSFKDQVGLLLQRIQPKLLAVDLDNTLWPGNCFECTTGPYVCNQFLKAPRTVACLDPQTGRGKTLSLFPDVREILEFLGASNVVLTICSRSPNKVAAMGILDTLGLWQLFVLPQVSRSRKTYHFRNLRDCLDVDYRDCLHFDDCPRNIEAVGALGVIACPVQLGAGLTWETLLAGLQMYELAHLTPMQVNAPANMINSLEQQTAVGHSPTASQLRPGKRVRWSLNPTYFEESTSELEKTDGDDSTDDSSSSCDDGMTPPAEAPPPSHSHSLSLSLSFAPTDIGVKRKLSPVGALVVGAIPQCSTSPTSTISQSQHPRAASLKKPHFSFPDSSSVIVTAVCS